MPARCPITWRVVIGHGFCGKAGQYFCTGASRSSLPRSHSSIAAVAVSDLEIEASRKSVCSLAGALFSAPAGPKPLRHSYSPFSTTATETPGTWVEAMNLETAFSIRVRFSGESLFSCACEAQRENAQKRTAATSDLKMPDRRENLSCKVMSCLLTKFSIVGEPRLHRREYIDPSRCSGGQS